MEIATPTLRVGHILTGSEYTYHIEKVLGQGSFGITYLATTKAQISGKLGNIETEIKVAVKEFFMKEFSSRHEDGTITEMTGGSLVQNYSKKFRKEAENLAKLSHPNIVNVLEVFDANNTCYYAMQYIPGGSLDEYVKKRGGLPEDEAIECICQIGAAVQYMHDHRMLHLDLKPLNVMRSEDGTKMVLIDFGLSKQYEANGNPESSTTIGLGTPGYAPIEQSSADRDKDFTPALDVYALGATFFKLLTGQTPPKASDVLNEGFPFEILHQKGVSRQSINAIESAMEPRKPKRLPDVNSFLSLLSASIDGGDDETDIANREPKPEPKPVSKPKPEPKPDAAPKPSFPLWLKWMLAFAAAALLLFFGIRSCGGNKMSPAFGSIAGHEYVDLGLPSGLLWATCNVGASSPSDYGGYYAWGETSTKKSYDWSNLKYCNDSTGDSFSKYNWDQAGTKDNKMRLDLSDDAARANWGGSWRMPTVEEWEELTNNCTWTWTNQGGHNGYEVTGKNGNSIFLPAAGSRNGERLSGARGYGSYWSSSFDTDRSLGAFGCYFVSGNVDPSDWECRCGGHSVRPVCSSLSLSEQNRLEELKKEEKSLRDELDELILEGAPEFGL